MSRDQDMRRVNELTHRMAQCAVLIREGYNPASAHEIGGCASYLKQVHQDTAELGELINQAARQAPPHDLPEDAAPLKLAGGTGGAA